MEQDEELKAAGFDVEKLTDAQKYLIMMPHYAPENYYMDGEISAARAKQIWVSKLNSSGLSEADVKRAKKMLSKS